MTRESPVLKMKIDHENSLCNMQVVFVDIVSYSRRKTSVQVEVIKAFMDAVNEALISTAREYLEKTSNIDVQLRRDIVVLPSGDGVAIAFPFVTILDMHIFFARELLRIVEKTNIEHDCRTFQKQEWCDCHDGFLLRCGISDGLLVLYKDLNSNFNVAGNVVNMAARVMDRAGSSQIFLTQEAYKKVIDFGVCSEEQFKEYRNVRIKHGLNIDIYQCLDNSLGGLDISPRSDFESSEDRAVLGDERKPAEIAHSDSGTHQVRAQEAIQKADFSGSILRNGTDLVKSQFDRMVLIPAGEFLMNNERQTKVLRKISKPFLVDKYPITQAVYLEVMGVNPSRFACPNFPVENISWLDAAQFCNKLSEKSGLAPVYKIGKNNVTVNFKENGYRLPTEVEWEYCCRAGGKEGSLSRIDEIAWYNSNAEGGTHEVGTKVANDFGLYDMLGNVWEWCNDFYKKNYSEEELIDYAGPADGHNRILRGGSWTDGKDCIKPSFRFNMNELAFDSTYGMRVVLWWSE